MPSSRLVFTLGFANLKYPSVHIKQQLHRFARSRWALSTVVTTLIIIVISVLLASVVTYFAINVTSTRVQEESLALAKQHVWYDSSNQKAQAAIMIINAGGRDIVIDRLTVRGQECAWSKVLYFVTGESISGDLSYNTTLIDGGSISVGGSSRVFKQATTDLTLQSGKTLIIYMSNPDSISVNDIGLTVSVNIFTSQAMYYKETNVQGTSGTTTTSGQPVEVEGGITLPYARAYWTTDMADDVEVAMVLVNSGSSTKTIDLSNLLIKGAATTNAFTQMGFYASSSLVATNDLPYLSPLTGPVQEQTLNVGTGFLYLHAHETAIVYFYWTGLHDTGDITSSDLNNDILVGISLGASESVTKTVTVQPVV
jgi:hypothetical protein